MVETLPQSDTDPKSDIDTSPRIYREDGVTYAYHDYAQFVVIRYVDGYMTGRAMTDMEIRQGEQLRRVRAIRPEEVEALSFTADLARHMKRPRFWWDCLVMFALLAVAVAACAILQLGAKAHLINH